jgi:flagella basal body P-ring formation protein FlgA
MQRILAIALLLLAGSSVAAEQQRVPASQLIAAAQTALEKKAGDAHLVAHFGVVGHIDDLSVAHTGAVDLHATVQDPWLRERIGVPVQVLVADHKVSSVTVWFSVTAPIQATVYSASYARGALASSTRTQVGSVDLARTHGASMPALGDVAGLRLHRAVEAGEAVLPTDFEAVPDVQAQQPVRIDAVSGVVRLSTTGRALADGKIGQTIAVLPRGATEPVHALVVSPQVVTIEN